MSLHAGLEKKTATQATQTLKIRFLKERHGRKVQKNSMTSTLELDNSFAIYLSMAHRTEEQTDNGNSESQLCVKILLLALPASPFFSVPSYVD